jgi:hypothetical protein
MLNAGCSFYLDSIMRVDTPRHVGPPIPGANRMYEDNKGS